MQIVLVYSQVVNFSYVKISNDVTVINFFSNVINLQLGNSATGYPFQSRSLSHIPFEFLFPFRTFDMIWIRVYSSFIMNMSDSLTSGDFSRVALEKLLWITLGLVKGTVAIFFRVRVILNVCPTRHQAYANLHFCHTIYLLYRSRSLHKQIKGEPLPYW